MKILYFKGDLTPLMVASSNKYYPFELIDLLISKKGKLSIIKI